MTEIPKTRTLRELSRLSPTDDEIDVLLSEIDTHNHRAAAVLGGAFVEDALEYAIQRRFLSLSKAESEFIFEYPGPLSSFDAKIRAGFGIGLYGTIVRNDLHVIRRVRNAFAHAKKPISFDTPEEGLSRCPREPHMMYSSLAASHTRQARGGAQWQGHDL